MLEFIGGILGILAAPIQAFVALFLIALGAFIVSIPELLWQGIKALWRGLFTVLVPARRADWLNRRRENRAFKRRLREQVAEYELNAPVDEESLQLARMRKESEQRLATLLRRHEQARRQRVRRRMASVADTSSRE
ncbi:hypothetical protein OG594_00850 [Streptomyces sp. NBC_01214]|uniref:hypothetical protein n=1 Tax=Streptomyces sp. NBC_01214 TaxID=2903777 RepID=UPI00225902C9|nr:hypothetical protein [Streptomyces sp. NBC_01214]MCX4800237.1 hypothetical protein [Streptomyces sp. NBC_01214]